MKKQTKKAKSKSQSKRIRSGCGKATSALSDELEVLQKRLNLLEAVIKERLPAYWDAEREKLLQTVIDRSRIAAMVSAHYGSTREAKPSSWESRFENNSSSYGALQLFKQIEDDGDEVGFWLVSAIDKLRRGAHPAVINGGLVALLSILEEAMPISTANFREWWKETQ